MTVLVVGAGPTGLTLGCELLRHGVHCRVIDAIPEPSTKSKALALWPRTLEMFERLGIAEGAIELGLSLHTGVINSRGRPTGGLSLDAVQSRYRFGLILPQPETERLLTERLEQLGGRVERDLAFVDATQREDRVDVTLSRSDAQESAACEWLVGCDGARSAVRDWLGAQFEGERYDECFLLADVLARSSLPDDRAQYFLSPAGMLHVVPLPADPDDPGDGAPFRFTFDLDADDEASKTPTEAEIETEIDRRAPTSIEIVALRWSSRFRIQRRLVTRYRTDRCFLAGDAAHVHSPAGGQGINAGVQDSMNLGWKLALVDRGLAAKALLDSYELERKPIAETVARETDRVTRMGMLRGPLATAVRDTATRALDRAGVLRRAVVPAMAGLEVSYANSPIVCDTRRGIRRSRRPAAGDRVPDPAVDATSEWLAGPLAAELHEALSAPVHTALLFRGGDGPSPAERECAAALEAAFGGSVRVLRVATEPGSGPDAFLDPGGRCHTALGITGSGAALVRPDGHIALISAPIDVRALRAYVDELLPGPGRSSSTAPDPEPATIVDA